MRKFAYDKVIPLLCLIFWTHCSGSTTQMNSSLLSSSSPGIASYSSPTLPTFTPKPCKPTARQKALRIGGITLASLGVASLITGGALWWLDGQPSGPCSPDGIHQYSACKWSSKGASALALGLGGAGVIGGGLMLGFSYGDSSKSTVCE